MSFPNTTKPIYPLLLIFCALLFSLPGAFAQTNKKCTIRGKITDAATQEPLENVNVFLDNTTIGDVSDKNGLYEITNVAPGNYTLVVSMVGYQVEKITLQIITDKQVVRDFQLKMRIFQFKPLEITAEKDRNWKKNLEKFKKLFIGTSPFAGQCNILNPEVLAFSSTPGSFLAEGDEPLEIENRAFGYKIRFILETFKTADDELSYTGQTQFMEQPSGDEKEMLRRQKNRQKAYTGSLRHFLKSVLNKRHEQEGFIAYQLAETQKENKAEAPAKITGTPIKIEKGILPFERKLSFPGRLLVEYTRERAEDEYTGGERQLSWIELTGASVLTDTLGNLLYRQAIKQYGYWGWKRVGDLLPMDYVPESSALFSPAATPAIDSLAQLFASKSYDKIHGELVAEALDELVFKNCEHKTLLKQLYTDIVDILNKMENAKWQRLKTNKEKAEFLRHFWLLRDLSFGTKRNERLDEHYGRLDFARKFYSSLTSEGYDERGRIYLKYGPPEAKMQDVNPGLGKSTETWVYQMNGRQITFDFIDKIYGYSLMQNIGENLVSSPNPITRFESMGTILQKRQDLSLTYFNAYNYYLELKKEDDESKTYEEKLKVYENKLIRLGQRLNEIYSDEIVKQERLPEATSKLYENLSELKYSVKPALFENEGKNYILALAYGMRESDIKFSQAADTAQQGIKIQMVIRNRELVDLSLKEDTILPEALQFDENGELVRQYQIPIKTNYFYIIAAVDNPAGSQKGFKDYSIKFPVYKDRQLHLSSVIFAKQISPVDLQNKPSETNPLVRHNLEIQMYPFTELRATEPIYLYFEIYDLQKNEEAKTRYQIEYTVTPVKKKGFVSFVSGLNPFKRDKGKISISYEQEGSEETDYFSIRLDFSQLAAGNYTMVVRVKDKIAGDSKEAKTAFALK